MTKKRSYIFGFIFLFLTVGFSLLAKFFDVADVKEVSGTKIGLSRLNFAVHEFTGVNMGFYKLTNIMGYIAIALGLLFALFALIKLIRVKSFKKIDRFYYALGVTYIVLGATYAIFEKVIVNYRPIIMPDNSVPEASFPSSHTLLIFGIMITALITFNKILKDKKALRITADVICVLFIAVGVLGRLASGVHWFSDILASVLFALAIAFFFNGAIKENK